MDDGWELDDEVLEGCEVVEVEILDRRTIWEGCTMTLDLLLFSTGFVGTGMLEFLLSEGFEVELMCDANPGSGIRVGLVLGSGSIIIC